MKKLTIDDLRTSTLLSIKLAILPLFGCLVVFFSCIDNQSQKQTEITGILEVVEPMNPEPQTPDFQIIIASNYTFEEAIAGTHAPQEIIDQLELFDVIYISTDGKLHQGQMLTNKSIAQDVREIFEFMLKQGFVIERVVPIVRYNWCDKLSMAANNSSSFNYRTIAGTNQLSLHATGMAIDINPFFNPVRWKTQNRPNEPEGAVHDPTVNGTLYPVHPVVEEFRRRGFRWGHTFTRFYDDHHFEKR
jgi:hypothetical protein